MAASHTDASASPSVDVVLSPFWPTTEIFAVTQLAPMRALARGSQVHRLKIKTAGSLMPQ